MPAGLAVPFIGSKETPGRAGALRHTGLQPMLVTTLGKHPLQAPL